MNEARAAPGHPHHPPGAPAEDQDGRQDDIDDHRGGLDDHAGLEVAGAAKGRPHRHHEELQGHRRHHPREVLDRQAPRALVGAHRAGEGAARRQRDHQEREAGCNRQALRLVEDDVGALAVLAPGRVRDQRGRSDAQHLRGGEHEEHQVAADGHGRHRVRPEAADPVEVDEDVERLEDHADEHEARGLQQVRGDRAGREILHGETPSAGESHIITGGAPR